VFKVKNRLILISNYLILLYAFLLPLNKNIVSIIGKILIIMVFIKYRKNIRGFFVNLYKLNWFKVYSLLVIFSVFISFYSSSFFYGIEYTLKKYLPYFEIFAIAFLIEKKFLKYTISAFLSGIFISEIISYGIFFNLWTTTYYRLHGIDIHDPTPFMHHTYYSLFLSIGILVSILTLFKEEKLNFVLLFFTITMTINLFITGGRGGQLAFFITAFLLVLFSKEKKLLLLIPIIILIFILAYSFSNIFHYRVNLAIHDIKILISNLDFCSSWGIRVSAWVLSFEMIKEHWLFGLGYNNYVNIMKNLINTHYQNLQCSLEPLSTHLHNQYLTMLVDGGVIYLSLFIYGLYQFIKLPLKDEYFDKIKIVVFSNFVILSFIEPVFFQSWSMYLFIFFAGILLAEYRFEHLGINYKNP
jgi:O-antigen ligase